MNTDGEFVINGLRFSESIAKFMPAFIASQKKMDAVIKDSTAVVPTKTGGKYEYTYAKLENVIDVVKPALLENGIAYVQAPYNAEGGGISVQTMFIHESAEWMSGVLTLKPETLAAQQVGSVISYARRYALLAMAGLAAEDDDGKSASKKGKADAPSGTGTNADAIMALAKRAADLDLIPDATQLELKQWATKNGFKWNAASLPAIEATLTEREAVAS